MNQKSVGRTVNNLLGRIAGIRISRARNMEQRKQEPIPMVINHALRFLYFYDLMLRIREIKGDIVECGVGAGRSLFYFCLILQFIPENRLIYGFDSFKGFPSPSKMDEPGKSGVKEGRYKISQNTVIQYLKNSGIDPAFLHEKIRLIPGFFSETLPQTKINEISFLHLDVDLYSSYQETLDFFYPKVSKGGIIAFDEYQSRRYPGAKKAIDEFFWGREQIRKSDFINRYFIIKE